MTTSLMETCRHWYGDIGPSVPDSAFGSSTSISSTEPPPFMAGDTAERPLRRLLDVRSDEDSDFGSSCSVSSLDPPPFMAPGLTDVTTHSKRNGLTRRQVKSELMTCRSCCIPPRSFTMPSVSQKTHTTEPPRSTPFYPVSHNDITTEEVSEGVCSPTVESSVSTNSKQNKVPWQA